jgi:hypothetical protein
MFSICLFLYAFDSFRIYFNIELNFVDWLLKRWLLSIVK